MVYRPPKKKAADGPGFPANRSEADPLEGPLLGRGDSTDVRAGDDRRLVMVDQNFQDADFEDRVWLFWRKQQGTIYALLAFVFAVVLAWQGSRLYEKHKLAQTQEDYQAADSPAALQSFARDHADSPLARVAILQAADDFYKKSQYKEAAQAYAQAVTLWGAEPYAQRARIGGAMATVLSGDEAGGRKQLEAISTDTQVSDNFRAQADYYNALLALKAGDIAGAQKWIASVKGLPQGGEWVNSATSLETLEPALMTAKTASPLDANMPSPLSSVSAPGQAVSAPASVPANNTPVSSGVVVPVAPVTPSSTPAAPAPISTPAASALPTMPALSLPAFPGSTTGNNTTTPAK